MSLSGCFRKCFHNCVSLKQTMQECNIRDLRILDYLKRTEELETRLKVQKNMYSAMHQERHMYR